MMNKAKFDAYPPEIQQAIREAENYQLEHVSQAWEDSLAQIRAAGVKVNEIENIDEFRETVAPVVDKYADEIGGNLFQKVRDLSASAQ